MERQAPAWRSIRHVCVTVSFTFVLLGGTQSLIGEDRATQPSSISPWITDLGSRSFQTREAAMRKLLKAGQSAFKLILHATQSNDPEVASCAVRLLTKMATDDDTVFDALSELATADTRQAVTAGHIVGSPGVRASNRARRQEKVDRLVREAQHELNKGKLIAAREIADRARKLSTTFQLADAGEKTTLFKFKFVNVQRAAKSGFPEAKVQLRKLDQLEKRHPALKLLNEARVALRHGDVDSARKKALAAKKLDVAYGLFDDRPEHVLADIARLRKARPAKQKK